VPEPVVAVIIVGYNTRPDLARCLASLAAQPDAARTAITVVDNGSADGSQAMVRDDWPSVRLIEANANLGFSRANNLGIRATASELVLLLNPDTVVPAGALARLEAALRADDGAAAVGPRLVDADGRPELSFGPMISPWGELRQRTLVRAYARGSAWAVRHVERATRRPGPRDWVSGACLLARRADLDAVGLLDERFFMYTEDVDLCAALRARGRRVLFAPEAEIVHLRGRAGVAAPRATERLRRLSHVAFYRKHHPWAAPLLAWWLRRRRLDVSDNRT
jgi:N-acetylglucosaminyl-diphospho-decaprenol L-rhamnosyltransferase